jgi:hypothetical protein
MRKVLAFISLFSFPVTAHAQTAMPFEPYTITAQEHQALLNYLGDVPSKYANPIINQLMQMEQAAQQKKAAEITKTTKPADKK